MKHLVLHQVLLYTEILHKVDHYLLLVDLLNLLHSMTMRTSYCLHILLHLNLSEILTGSVGMHRLLKVDYSVLVVVLKKLLMIIMSSHMIYGLLKTKVLLQIVLQPLLILVQLLRFNTVERKIKELSGGMILLVLDILILLQVLQIITLLVMVSLDSTMELHGVSHVHYGHKKRLMSVYTSTHFMLLLKQVKFLLLVKRRHRKNLVILFTNLYGVRLDLVDYLLLVVLQRELNSNQLMIQHCLISSLHLHTSATLTDMHGVMLVTTTYPQLVVQLNLLPLITTNLLSTHMSLMMKVTLLITQQYLVSMVDLEQRHKEKQITVPQSLLKQHIL